jgi:hypothetical protein
VKKGALSEYFSTISAKRLSAVEANTLVSNQHEFNGVLSLKKIFGNQRLEDIPTHFLWLNEESGLSDNSYVTWYDARESHPRRSEFRLYFKSNAVMDRATANDLIIFAKRTTDQLVVIVVTQDSTIENQLLWLFGIPFDIGSEFTHQPEDALDKVKIDGTTRYILDELAIELHEHEDSKLDKLIEEFDGNFPTTAVFSTLARTSTPDVNPLDDPDLALLAWLDQEEKMFRRLERKIVSERLKNGFWENNEADVDGFIKFSLGVQNRRKSRAGHALENHMQEIFRSYAISFDRQTITENKSKPDFLFPSGADYHNIKFPLNELTMLGVKSSCKDRWRQVLTEAARIHQKHLFTLEPGISENQTNEMQANNLQLVLPKRVHDSYRPAQRKWLLSLSDFLEIVQHRQKSRLKLGDGESQFSDC